MRNLSLLACLAAVAFAPSPTEAIAVPPIIGKWANPKGTLAVQTHGCTGGRLCGEIVWASAAALADAREAGVPRLVGTPLLQDYRAAGPGDWSGRVYVPDMGRTFSSHIKLTSPDTLAISGCLVGRLFCRTQVWHRVP